ncbi:hypothetical protein ACRAWF_46315 [Streptomyces sp. L7]
MKATEGGSAQAAVTGAPAGDVIVSGYGDSTGYHLAVGTGAGGYAWREVAVVRPGDIDDSSWTGYQCVSGDGRYIAVTVLRRQDGVSGHQVAARDTVRSRTPWTCGTGTVRPVAEGVGLRSTHSPGCGPSTPHRGVLTVNPGDNEHWRTRVLSVDLRSAKVTLPRSLGGMASSARADLPAGTAFACIWQTAAGSRWGVRGLFFFFFFFFF